MILVEYGDYECPYCGQAYEILKQIQSQMGDRLRFVFRNFPLSQLHPHAKHAAEVAEAAAQQGQFWPMHDMLFENQQQLSDEALMDYATQLGLDKDQFRTALQSGKLQEKIQSDFESGVESGVNGTPTFFINGSRFDGNWQSEDLLVALQAAL